MKKETKMPPGSKKKNSNHIKKVSSIGDLRCRCNDEKNPDREKYQKLAIIASNNLGGPANATLEQAFRWLILNAQESEIAAQEIGETFDGEKGVVDEINFCIPCL
jgi:hypothetical protein